MGPLNQSYNGYKYILTIEDDLTKFIVAIPLINQEAFSVAKAFVKDFVCTFGIPNAIHSDQGTNFMSVMFSQMCKLLSIRKINSTAYHPQSNAVERYHRTLGEYFRNFCYKDPLNWDEWLSYASFTYNSTPHSMTQCMPFELVFGNKPNIPTSIQKEPEPYYNYEDYALECRNKFQNAWKIARDNIIRNKEISKKYYDKNTISPNFVINDQVLLKRETNTHSKFDPKWDGPYEIINTDSPENSTIRIKEKNITVHNNRLVHYKS